MITKRWVTWSSPLSFSLSLYSVLTNRAAIAIFLALSPFLSLSLSLSLSSRVTELIDPQRDFFL